MQDHRLRPVPPVNPEPEDVDSAGPTSQDKGDRGRPAAGPAKAKPRPSRALPTDRMKLEVQKKALSTIAILSEYGKRGVGGADMAPRLDIAPTTAGLNNSFFHESKLIERTGKGRFKSTEAANDFARRFSFNEEEAGLSLRGPLSDTWYFKTVSQQIAGFGPTAKEKLIELLAYEAETTKDYRVQLGSLLSWLEYAGLIELEDGQYKLAADAPEPTDAPESGGDAAETNSDAKEDEPKPSPTQERTTGKNQGGGQGQPTETILGFNFDFALTGDQLAKLSPEQITALFKAVGEVMAIKAATAE